MGDDYSFNLGAGDGVTGSIVSRKHMVPIAFNGPDQLAQWDFCHRALLSGIASGHQKSGSQDQGNHLSGRVVRQ